MKQFFESVGNWFLNNWQPIVTTLAIIIFGLIIVKVILAIVRRQLAKTKMEKTVQSFAMSILKFVLYLILIFCVISALGVSVTGLTVVISAASLAISLAMQDSLKNLVNGFVIISTSLFKDGDWVKIGGEEGTIIKVSMLYTTLKTGDNKRVTIPNSKVLSSEVTNYNVLKTRRVDLTFDISYNSNVDQAKEIVKEVIASCGDILEDPESSVVLSNLGASAVTLSVKVWVNAGDYWSTKWYLIDNIFNEFKRNNITIPYNQLEVALVDPNQKSYIREEKLAAAATHKIKPEEDDDIISSFNKTIKKATSKRPKKAKKSKKTEETK